MKSLNTRLSAMKQVGKVATSKTRKIIADGVFKSKLVYLISLWGGCEKYLIRSLQIVQNKAARVVTKLDWNTNTQVLLSQCGWLSVLQLAVYHTLVLVHTVLQTRQPEYLHSFFSLDYRVKTRLADQQILKPSQVLTPEHDLVTDSFRWRALRNWNSLPLDIRSISSTTKFKLQARIWVKANVPLE